MGNKTRHTANLVSDNNLFVDIANDRVGIGSTQPTAKLNVVGVVSATSFRGDGSQLSGISVDSTSLVDSNSVTRVQATTTGAIVSGILTATSFSGSGAGLTSIPSSQLTGALPSIDGSNLTGITTSSSITIGVRQGSALSFPLVGGSFNVSSRSGTTVINITS